MSWVFWAILSAIFAAATALLAKVGVAHVDSNLATALRTSVVLVFAWGIALALGKHGEIRTLDRRTIFFLARVAASPPASSWLCYFRALQLGPASRVAPLDKLSVPLVIIFAWLLLGEKSSIPRPCIGGLLITAGAIDYGLRAEAPGDFGFHFPILKSETQHQKRNDDRSVPTRPASPHRSHRLHGLGQEHRGAAACPTPGLELY